MKNNLLPQNIIIEKITKLSPTVKLFRFGIGKGDWMKKNENGFIFNPGQFVLIGKVGYGEAPFVPMSSCYEKKYIELAIRKTGRVTDYLHSLKVGDEIDLRGPFGNGFSLDFFKGKDVVMASGGCGIPPVSALTEYIIKNRDDFGRVYFLYGAKDTSEILVKEQMKRWQGNDINVVVTIDKPEKGWDGPVGFVSELVDEMDVDELNSVAVMCGPGPMVNALEKIFKPLGISDRRIFVSMERKMQCGVGKCQHCTVGRKYVCTDGPVFNYDEIDKSHD